MAFWSSASSSELRSGGRPITPRWEHRRGPSTPPLRGLPQGRVAPAQPALERGLLRHAPRGRKGWPFILYKAAACNEIRPRFGPGDASTRFARRAGETNGRVGMDDKVRRTQKAL